MPSDRAIAQAFRAAWAIAEANDRDTSELRAIVQSAAELDATPPAGAGEAVAWECSCCGGTGKPGEGVVMCACGGSGLARDEANTLRDMVRSLSCERDGAQRSLEAQATHVHALRAEVERLTDAMLAPTPLPDAVRELVAAVDEYRENAGPAGATRGELADFNAAGRRLDAAIDAAMKENDHAR
jgi:hypothetical protein